MRPTCERCGAPLLAPSDLGQVLRGALNGATDRPDGPMGDPPETTSAAERIAASYRALIGAVDEVAAQLLGFCSAECERDNGPPGSEAARAKELFRSASRRMTPVPVRPEGPKGKR